jgi:outer membrane protein assembly factor BamA
MTAAINRLGLGQFACACVTCPFTFVIVIVIALLPQRTFADAAPEPSSGVSISTQAMSVAAPLAIQSGSMIGTISIFNESIFDLDDPEENKALYQLANKVHKTTRPDVIQQQLLFHEGDEFSSRILEESERILRSNRYIQDATIEAVRQENGIVDVSVRTTDVWTLMPKISFSRSGGENRAGIGIKEMNLLGTGMEVEALYKSDVDRDSKIIKMVDRHLGDSWYSLSTIFANSSDGHTAFANISKPFYSLDSNGAHGLSFFDNQQIDSLYDRGEVQTQYDHQANSYEIFRGWSNGLHDGWIKRYTAGVVYDEHRFSAVDNASTSMSIMPDDRKFVYPFIGIELLQDKFEKAANLDQINRTEDRYLGSRISARLGAARSTFGSDRDAWMINTAAQTGFGSAQKNSLVLATNLTTRLESEDAQNFSIDVSARYYKRQSEKRLFYASLSGTFGHNLDIDNQVLLGGDNGLRGYPLRFQSGDKRALLTLEQRFFSDWYPFRLFHVGGAVFFDAGRAWGDSPISDQDNDLLKDIGFGLRIGNSRSGLGRVIHIDVAFPLDGDNSIKNVQLLIETKKSF